MEYRILGRTGVKVSSLCFGTMTFGREADEATSIKMFYRCRDAGINFFDTADRYGAGTSETILGKCIAEGREKIILSTKVGNPVGDDVNDRGLSRRHIRLSVEKSLKRLGTDYIDLYFLHSYDPKTSIEETLSALKDLQSQGKVLYIGASNWSAWQIAKAIGLAELKRFLPFECIQPMYSLVKRQAEVEMFPLAKEENLGVITYSPLAGGLLTGKYIHKDNLLQGRILEHKLYERRYANPAYYEIAEKLVSYAKYHGSNPAALAVAWVMSNPVVTAPIIGARNLKQLEQTLAALEIEMTPEMRKEISDLSIAPPPATDRSEEKIDK
jgi:aryl-alcohol dehydrogenase-like predicted oxidoreductase